MSARVRDERGYLPPRVALETINDQRDRGWPDFHPEDYCHRCGDANMVWSAPAALWNRYMRSDGPAAPWRWNEIICPTCFVEVAEASAGPLCWVLARDEHGMTRLDVRHAEARRSARDATRLLAQLVCAVVGWWRWWGCEDCANEADERACPTGCPDPRCDGGWC